MFAILAGDFASDMAFELTTQKAGVLRAVRLDGEPDVILQPGAVVMDIALASRIVERRRHALPVEKRWKWFGRRRVRRVGGTRQKCEMNGDSQRVAALARCLSMRHDLPDM